MPKPPVECSVCEKCTCYCAKTVTNILFESGDEPSDLRANIEKIKERIDYLEFLRVKLERKIKMMHT